MPGGDDRLLLDLVKLEDAREDLAIHKSNKSGLLSLLNEVLVKTKAATIANEKNEQLYRHSAKATNQEAIEMAAQALLKDDSAEIDKEAARLAALAKAYTKVADQYKELVEASKAKTKTVESQINNLQNN